MTATSISRSTSAAIIPSCLRNDGGNQNHWLEVLLIGTRSNRDGIGASLKLTSEGFVHVEQSKGGMSYMSASDPRIFFGLGKRTKIESLEITWPSGQVDKLTNLPVDRIIAVKEGTGIVPHVVPKITPKAASSMKNPLRRRFLGSSSVLLGSALLDALTSPLWKWKRSLLLDAAAEPDSSSAETERFRFTSGIASRVRRRGQGSRPEFPECLGWRRSKKIHH